MLKERQTVEELAKKYDLHPSQLHLWKKYFLEHKTAFFSEDTKTEEQNQASLIKELKETVGDLTLQVNFLKKKLN